MTDIPDRENGRSYENKSPAQMSNVISGENLILLNTWLLHSHHNRGSTTLCGDVFLVIGNGKHLCRCKSLKKLIYNVTSDK